jgi:hypothetical protein
MIAIIPVMPQQNSDKIDNNGETEDALIASSWELEDEEAI